MVHSPSGEELEVTREGCDVSGWLLRLGGREPDAHITTRTDWHVPQIRVYSAEATGQNMLQCKLPTKDGEEFVVGRSSRQADLAIDDDVVSRRHIKFFVQRSRHYIEDLNSSHGTKVNDQEIKGRAPVMLSDGDRITLGQTEIEFESPLDWMRPPTAAQEEPSEVNAAAEGSVEPEAASQEGSGSQSSSPVENPEEESSQEAVPAPPRKSVDLVVILIILIAIVALGAVIVLSTEYGEQLWEQIFGSE